MGTRSRVRTVEAETRPAGDVSLGTGSPGPIELLTDLYELTMVHAYWREEMFGTAVFELFVRRLPETRNYLLACGVDDVLTYLESLRFEDGALAYLAARPEFSEPFVEWLSGFRFSGRVRAMHEGTPVFANEPLIEIEAPLPEAQLVETLVINQVQLQTMLASKAARVVAAAGDRAVVDFGLRRMHGTDAGIKSSRAFYIAGVAATSNVLAGQRYGIPITGTMAHSYVQSHDDEMAAFRAFTELYPDTILLVDTYDTLHGIENVIALAREMGDAFRVRGVRLDSGDLAELAVRARELLDGAGLTGVEIFASGGLDEWTIAALIDSGAPIDGFGVGTAMGVSADAPALDIVYKMTAYGDAGRLKLSPGKPVLPGRKQVYRIEEDGVAERDVIARHDEDINGRPLLDLVMEDGRRTAGGQVDLDAARARARHETGRLPERIRGLDRANPPYRVDTSEALRAYDQSVRGAVEEKVEQ